MATGSVTLDFGSSPTFEATVAVADSGVGSGSNVGGYFQREDATPQYPMAQELISLMGGNISAGVGWTLYAVSKVPAIGQITARWVRN